MYSVSLNRIHIRYYISCSASWSGLWPDLPVSARRTRTGAGTRELMQGMIQNKTCNNIYHIPTTKSCHVHAHEHIYLS